MSLIKRNSSKDLFPTIPSFFDKMGWDNDFLSAFWNGKKIPAVNIVETDKEFSFELAVPGMNKKDFKITVDEGRLTISCEKEEKKEDKDKDYCRKEYSFHSFERSFQLPKNVQVDKVKAGYENGVLTIAMPKMKTEKVKVKEVTVA